MQGKYFEKKLALIYIASRKNATQTVFVGAGLPNEFVGAGLVSAQSDESR